MSAPDTNEAFEALLDYLKRNRCFDFTAYKRSSLMRRVLKRMQIVGIDNFSDYQDYLEVHPEGFPHLFNTILINVTSFFRDPPAWEYLAREIIPRMIAGKQPDGLIRVWSAGCASGEEAYTLAMVLSEALGPEHFRQRVKIYATDVDEDALAQARQATYSAKEVQEIPADLREKYFEQVRSRYVFRADLRRPVIFGRHDLVHDAPISRLDLLVCRNTLMYFNAESQSRILARSHFALNDTGYLFLGQSELLLTHANLFTPVELKYRIFAAIPNRNLRDRILVMAQTGAYDTNNHLSRQFRLRELAFDAQPVAQLVIDLEGTVVLACAEARSLFGLGARDIGRPLQDLDLSYRPVELRSLIDQAYAERHPIKRTNVERHFADGAVQYLEMQVTPLLDNGGAILGASITYTDMTQYCSLQKALEGSKQELQTAYEELQSSNEELETTNEELQSAKEELQTTNEELQSSNEELETMNEELHSSNEELQTLNEELSQRTQELNSANAFLGSILSSLRMAVVVVDTNLVIRVWNNQAMDLWGLRADEVEGQSFLNLEIGLPVERLKSPLRACLSGESPYQVVAPEVINRRGRIITCRVSCTPLYGPRREITGVILLMKERDRDTTRGPDPSVGR